MQKMFGLIMMSLMVCSCATVKYNALEKVGIHKRDILVNRVEKARDAQEDASEQFENALEQFKALTEFDGGDLEKKYNKLNSVVMKSETKAQAITDRVDAVEKVAKDLFKEWRAELGEYQNVSLKKSSEKKLRATEKRYEGLIDQMRASEVKVQPVLAVLKDQVLFLKHNLNAQAIGSLKSELSSVEQQVEGLVRDLQKSIREAEDFIAEMEQGA